jgi:hypothetical protein
MHGHTEMGQMKKCPQLASPLGHARGTQGDLILRMGLSLGLAGGGSKLHSHLQS